MYGSGTTTLIISDEEINDIMKIVQALEDCNISLKGVTKTIKNETKKQKGGFLRYFRGQFVKKFISRESNFKSWFWKEKRIVRAGTGKQWDF